MSNDYERGYQAASAHHAQGQMVQSIFSAFNARAEESNEEAWYREAIRQRNRVSDLEQDLAESEARVAQLEREVKGLRTQVEDEARLKEAYWDSIKDYAQREDEAKDRFEQLRSKADQHIRDLQLDVRDSRHAAAKWEASARNAVAEHNSLVDYYKIALDALKSSGAMTAGFAAIYKMLVMEVMQKHDPATFDSLDQNKRMSVMNEAWLAFIQGEQIDYFPDLTFSYSDSATPSDDPLEIPYRVIAEDAD